MKEQKDSPAFPERGLSELPNGEFIHPRSGMTLRDYFAAKAISGMDVGSWQGIWQDCAIEAARAAYLIADEMLKRRAL